MDQVSVKHHKWTTLKSLQRHKENSKHVDLQLWIPVVEMLYVQGNKNRVTSELG